MTAVDVVVVGAGCAGLSAATALVDAGVRVLVVEARPVLGGRTFATRDQACGEWVDNGQHVLLGCYHDTLAFLRRIGSEGLVSVQSTLRVPMVEGADQWSELRCPALPPPLNLVAGVLGWSALSWRERVSVLGLATAFSAAPVPHDQTVREWLAAHGQAPRLCDLLWEPLAVAALNQPVDTATATTFVEVVRRMLGPGPDDAALVLPIASLTRTFIDPAAAFVERRGGEVRAGSTARIAFRAGRAAGVELKDTPVGAAAVVSAVPWHALAGLCGEAAPEELAPTVANAAAMRSSPIVTANLWFDRPVLSEPFVGLPGRSFQWVFDRRHVTPGESTYVSMVCSGADHVVDQANDTIVARAHAELRHALPAVAGARLVRGTAVRERRATFSLAAGEPARPATATPVPGFFLAGDWIDTGLPATIESAVVSGHRAAAAALAYLGRRSSVTGAGVRAWRRDNGTRLAASREPLAAMKVLLAHYQEIALKGQNRPWFIRHLARNLRDALTGLDVGPVKLPMGRLEVALGPTADIDEARRRLRTVCGLANFAVAGTVAPDVHAITRAVLRDLPRDREVASFRVEVRRAHKQFPIASPDAERAIGSRIQDETGWRVDLSNPAFVVWVEIVPRQAYYYFDKEVGAGGLPVGTGGRVLVLISGGIDSPVAAWRMMRRGCHATFVHFHGHPFTSHASIDKVRELVRALAPYQLGAHVMFVPFGELQREVTMAVPGPMRVIVYRRLMMRIASRLARTVHARALVTGDVVGQVASQTLDNLAVVDRATDLLTVRPLVGMSKEEIIAEGVALGSYPISILPDEDCCTLFTPRHPLTRVRLSEVEAAERELPLEAMVVAAAAAPDIERVEWPV